MNRLVLIFVGLAFCFLSQAQDAEAISWKAYKNKAEDLIELRQYAKAAAAYEQAYTLKPQRGDLMIDAAKNYALERDFKNAARVYAKIIDNPKYKDAKLDYAYALKQSNQYEQAMLVFASYLQTLGGKDDKKEQMINKEIMGCQFALEQIEGFVVKPYGIDIMPISEEINSDKSDFAPYHVSDTKFYYSTLIDGNATIKTSTWMEGMWAEGRNIKGFSGLKSKHVCNAVVDADETEMYFTICNEDQVWGGLSSRCDIYVSSFKGKAWGQPKKLNENVNHDGSTNTQPYVLEKDGTQQIYFASNRPNGQGGMDLWFASRPIGEEEFGEAINLGPNVNTSGNEITPFFSAKENALYFSSDGHITMGGFDIMKAVGAEFHWSESENLGQPINSGADEKYYTIASNNTEGYFVSNRTSTGETIANEDIFSFNILPPHFFVEGLVSNEKDMTPVEQAEIYLYELKEKTKDRRLLSVQNANAGKYNYRLLPNRNYQLVVEAEGFTPNNSYVNTNNENLYVQELNILLSDTELQSPVASLDDALLQEEIAPSIEVPTTVADTPLDIEENFPTTANNQVEETTTVIEQPSQEGLSAEKVESIVDQVIAERERIELDQTIVDTPINELTFTETVTAVTENIKKDVPVKKATPNISETSIESNLVAKSNANTETYVAVDNRAVDNNFVSKGSVKVPTGTGIYKYDDSNEIYRKEGTLIGDKPLTYNAPTYATTANTVPAIEVPLDKYAPKKTNTAETKIAAKSSVSKARVGKTYQIQLIAVEYHNPANRRYDGIRNLGLTMNTEYIEGKGWTRVLLGSFKSEKEARSVLENARTSGFKRAFVVEYVNGVRARRL
jgi:tetratricopeptide (TPR) repeat protein/septal ring-binding cell division protein DamX